MRTGVYRHLVGELCVDTRDHLLFIGIRAGRACERIHLVAHDNHGDTTLAYCR